METPMELIRLAGQLRGAICAERVRAALPARWRSALAATSLLLASYLAPGPVMADGAVNIAVTLKDHQFTPSEIHVPSGKPVVLTVTNEDATPEEFDSIALKVEKVIPAKQYATIHLRPLAPGRYRFMGEYHPDTAQGVVVSE
jgi:heme/copper-type cytochrome/quinol oxidase subunit 2